MSLAGIAKELVGANSNLETIMEYTVLLFRARSAAGGVGACAPPARARGCKTRGYGSQRKMEGGVHVDTGRGDQSSTALSCSSQLVGARKASKWLPAEEDCTQLNRLKQGRASKNFQPSAVQVRAEIAIESMAHAEAQKQIERGGLFPSPPA